MDKPTEKRHHRRMKRDTMVTLESLKIGVNEDTRMINCSDNGLYFESDQFLQPGDDIFIEVENYLPDQPDPYLCHHAKIIWGRRLKNGPYTYGYGAEYVRLANEQNSSETDSDQIKDLRQHPRHRIAKRVSFQFENKANNGIIRDISRNGCFIENRAFLNVGQIFPLAIPGTKFVKNNVLEVEVVRLSPIGVGVIFKSHIKQKTQT
jgi:hypothetical protein